MAITVYSADYCPFCRRLLALLDRKGVDYQVEDVVADPGKRREMMDRSQRHTVPQLFVNERHIGDCSEVHELEAAGELDAILTDQI